MRRIRPKDLPEPRAREVLQRFCTQAHRRAAGRVQQIIVYGSMARGDASRDSDLDLWVDWQGDEAAGRQILGGLAGEIFADTGLLISVHVVDASHRRRLESWSTGFFRNVQREGLLVDV